MMKNIIKLFGSRNDKKNKIFDILMFYLNMTVYKFFLLEGWRRESESLQKFKR